MTLPITECSIKSFNPSKYSTNNVLKSSPKFSQYNSKTNGNKCENEKNLENIYLRMKTVLE